MRSVRLICVAALVLGCTPLKDPEALRPDPPDAAADGSTDSGTPDAGSDASATDAATDAGTDAGPPLDCGDGPPVSVQEILLSNAFANVGYGLPTEVRMLSEFGFTYQAPSGPAEIALALGTNRALVATMQDDSVGPAATLIHMPRGDPSSAETVDIPALLGAPTSIALAVNPSDGTLFRALALTDGMGAAAPFTELGGLGGGFDAFSTVGSRDLGGRAAIVASDVVAHVWLETDAAGSATYIRSSASFAIFQESVAHASEVVRLPVTGTRARHVLVQLDQNLQLWEPPTGTFFDVPTPDVGVTGGRGSIVGYRVGTSSRYHIVSPQSSAYSVLDVTCDDGSACALDTRSVIPGRTGKLTSAASFLDESAGMLTIGGSSVTSAGGVGLAGPGWEISSASELPLASAVATGATDFEDVQVASGGTPADFVVLLALSVRVGTEDTVWVGGIRFCGATPL